MIWIAILPFVSSILVDKNNLNEVISATVGNWTNSIISHGCHCKMLKDTKSFPGENIGGDPIDELDLMCQTWIKSRKCLFLKEGLCHESLNTTYTFYQDHT